MCTAIACVGHEERTPLPCNALFYLRACVYRGSDHTHSQPASAHSTVVSKLYGMHLMAPFTCMRVHEIIVANFTCVVVVMTQNVLCWYPNTSLHLACAHAIHSSGRFFVFRLFISFSSSIPFRCCFVLLGWVTVPIMVYLPSFRTTMISCSSAFVLRGFNFCFFRVSNKRWVVLCSPFCTIFSAEIHFYSTKSSVNRFAQEYLTLLINLNIL